LSNNFSYPIEVARQGLSIYQTGDKFDMMINNRPFSHFYNSYDRENYEESYNKNSYGFSKSMTTKLGDKYNKDKGLTLSLQHFLKGILEIFAKMTPTFCSGFFWPLKF